ncbi:MAG TPA: DNA adenine methylase [Bacteroidota bacterium]
MTIRRPVLRYYGGKYILARWIVSNLPHHRVYCEPYGGAASVLMQKPRSYGEIYNDIYEDVVAVFRVLRDPEKAKQLQEQLHWTPFSRAEWELSYQPCDDDIEHARRMIIRSYMGYGSDSVMRKSGFRLDGNRSGASPEKDWRNYAKHVTMFAERMRGVVIESRPAVDIIKQFDMPETLFYVDPPYLKSARASQKERYIHDMEIKDHRDLASVLRSVVGMVVLSGYESPLYDELYHGWEKISRLHWRQSKMKSREVLWLSPNIDHGLGLNV